MSEQYTLLWTNEGYTGRGETVYKVIDRGDRNDGFGRYLTLSYRNGREVGSVYSRELPDVIQSETGHFIKGFVPANG